MKTHHLIAPIMRPDPDKFKNISRVDCEAVDQYVGSGFSHPLPKSIHCRLIDSKDERVFEYGRPIYYFCLGMSWNLKDSFLEIQVHEMRDNVYGGVGAIIKRYTVNIDELTANEREKLDSVVAKYKAAAAKKYAKAIADYKDYLSIVEAAHELYPEAENKVTND